MGICASWESEKFPAHPHLSLPEEHSLSNIQVNQNYNKILERDWLSAARFEHYLDSVRVILVIGQYASFCDFSSNSVCNHTRD